MILGLIGFGQTMQPKEYNHSTFKSTEKEISEELMKLVPIEFHAHPEFGILPVSAPCEDCIELIHFRTDSTRMFVKKGSGGTYFYSQAAYGNLHFKDVNGNLIAYDPNLYPMSSSDNDIYRSNNQDFPLELNLEQKQSKIILNNGELIAFNNKLTLFHVSDVGITTNLGLANWADHSIGAEGILIIDAWPNIDIEIKYGLGEVKTNYIVKSNLNLPNGYLVILDQFETVGDFLLQMEDIVETNNLLGISKGTASCLNEDGEGFYLGAAFGYDQSGDKNNSSLFDYKIEGDSLGIWVPADWLNSPSNVYPLVIDPAVTSSATYTAGIMRFRFNGSFCGGPGVDCGYTLVVPRPANSTLTGATFSLVQETVTGFCFGCWMSEAGFYFQTTCGLDGYWGCNLNNPGTCTATNLAINGLVTCLPPACVGSVNFNIFNSYCYCSTGGACGVSCQRINNNTWSITISGTTLETLGNTATGNGSQTINDPTCAGTFTLNPSAANGVPGYTYSWSTGASTPTINVPGTPAVYTCTVTDACGVSRLATFNVGCPLPMRLDKFEAIFLGSEVQLSWTTLTEINGDFFNVQRSQDGISFANLAKIKSVENANVETNYSWIDESPIQGVGYYRLLLVDKNGDSSYSETESVITESDNNGLLIAPNPNKGFFELMYISDFNQEAVIIMRSIAGTTMLETPTELKKGYQVLNLDYSSLPKGMYIIQLKTKGKTISERLVIE